MPHPPLENSTDLTRLPKPNPLEAPRMLNTVRTVQSYRAQAGDAYCVLAGLKPGRRSG